MRPCLVDVVLSKSDLVDRLDQTKSSPNPLHKAKRADQPVTRVSRQAHDSADVEALQPFRLLADDIDPIDPRAAWPFPREGDETVDGVPLALEDRLHAPIGDVADPAGDARRKRPPPRRLPEEDALDVALNDDAATLHASRLIP